MMYKGTKIFLWASINNLIQTIKHGTNPIKQAVSKVSHTLWRFLKAELKSEAFRATSSDYNMGYFLLTYLNSHKI